MCPTEQAGASLGNATQPRWNEVLLAIREARGVTQDGWAARLGVSRRTVQRWERGEWPPDAGAEAGILAYCAERGLFRTFDYGPLAQFSLTPETLQMLLTEARMLAGRRSAIRGEPVAAPSDPATAAPSLGLPVPLTSFVGREEELATLRRVLGGTRLLTLTGAGGCGKSRLALQLAEELAWAYPHGIGFVELAALADPTLVPATVAAALGLRPAGQQPIVEMLTEHLAPRHLLLILDNCEHLLGACAVLVETLLRACPHLEILTTSREPLGIGGETLWRVPPLSLPGTTAGAGEADAVRLLVERARQYDAGFSLTVANEAAVVRICEQLDGMPLALELAAACVKVLSAEQIAQRLSNRFRLLTGGSRTALPRQQTLRATLDWSYDLLSREEQALLRRLSVFAGGWSLEAAEVVCADLPPDPLPKGKGHFSQPTPDSASPLPFREGGSGGLGLDLLTRLVDTSLVVAEQQGGAMRYRLLETVRQYAAEKLDEAGEMAIVRDRHLAWCLTLTQIAGFEGRGSREVEWLARLEQEHDNLRAALAWSLTGVPGQSPVRRGLETRKDPRSSGGTGGGAPERRGLGDRTGPPIQEETALRLAGALARFWELRGHLEEGRQWLVQALSMAEAAPPELRAKGLQGAGVLAYTQGDYAAARAHFEENLSLSCAAGDRYGIADAQGNLGRTALRQGDYATANAELEASLALHTELGHKLGIANVQFSRGVIVMRQGDYDAARACFEMSLALNRELENKEGIANALEEMVTVLGEQGNVGEQTALLDESLALYRELGDRSGVATVLGHRGMTAWGRGEYDRALTLLEESLALYRSVGDRRGIARLLGNQSLVAFYQRDYPRAVALCRESLALCWKAGDTWAITRYLPILAGAVFGQGQPERAACLFGAAAALREQHGTSLPPVIRPGHDGIVAAVRAGLGDACFDAAWSAGWAMSAEAALAYALADTQPVAGP